jgi:c-di-GMP-binding flagellar brake protein YcgR
MSNHDRDYSEKRDFIRMKVNTPAQILIEADDEPNCDAICNDLSGGGMSITVAKELALDSEVTVTVTSDHGHSPILKARCCVARVQVQEEGTYSVGLEIKEIIKEEEPKD